MYDQTTVYLSLAVIGLILFYLLMIPQFRSGAWMTIRVPKDVIRKTRQSAKKDKNEMLVKLDYNETSPNPIKRIYKKGNNGSVNPGLINREEVIIHTHPKVKSEDKITEKYENILRERPSIQDLQFSKRSGKELLVTPTGKIIEFDAEQANLKKLTNIEQIAQEKASEIIFPDTVNNAEKSAHLANEIFLKETMKAGVKYREFNTQKELKLKTRVK